MNTAPQIEGLEYDPDRKIFIDQETGEVFERFIEPTDETTAKVALAHLVRINAVLQAHKDQEARIKAKVARLKKRYDDVLAFYEAGLETIARAKKTGASWETEYGVCKFTHSGGSIEINDQAKAFEWVRKHMPTAIKVEESIVKTTLKSNLTEDMQLPPDVFTVVAPHENFKVVL